MFLFQVKSHVKLHVFSGFFIFFFTAIMTGAFIYFLTFDKYRIYTKQKVIIDFILILIKFTFYFNDDQALA